MEAVASSRAAMEARGFRVMAWSRLYASPAWPDPSDPPFVNAVAIAEACFDPAEALRRLHAIEAEYGRVRSRPNAPRTLDLDLLAVGELSADGMDGGPVLPHPRMHERAFVLAPLAEIAPGWVHPVLGQDVEALLSAVRAAGGEAWPIE